MFIVSASKPCPLLSYLFVIIICSYSFCLASFLFYALMLSILFASISIIPHIPVPLLPCCGDCRCNSIQCNATQRTVRWENEADVVPVRDWMVERPWLPVIIVLLYLLLIIAGKSYFKTRPAWNWRSAMAAWNLSLSVFSAIGFLRTAPRLFLLLRNYTWKENLCMDPESHFGSGNTGLWVQLFVLSKIPYVWNPSQRLIIKKKTVAIACTKALLTRYSSWSIHGTNYETSHFAVFFCLFSRSLANWSIHSSLLFTRNL